MRRDDPALPATYTAARDQGARFYAGKPCSKHPNGVRYTSTKQCIQCAKEARRAWQRINADAINAKRRKVALTMESETPMANLISSLLNSTEY